MKNLLWLKQRKWKPISFVFFLQLVSVISLAQVRISGKVSGPDGKGISLISVSIRNTTLGTSTDANGNYHINGDIKQGTYTIEFSGIGFKSREEILTVGANASYTINSDLVEDALNLDEVVVTGTN
ncbi:MAG TPA: carboxypeptidase-like regulatory domain-containing protein, partial [Chitinophagaceae bacterium]|nr:carboxypeptidase-like regulatory domain-containing protein [Chitinophagaceae bacterium]